jgi:hypothetical protein
MLAEWMGGHIGYDIETIAGLDNETDTTGDGRSDNVI